jgi:UDP-GlcNAc3NAcA epimerase
MKIVTVIGARPQFVKLGPLAEALAGKATELVVHTGQHYDTRMSKVFFDDMGLPEPAVNLGIGSGYHGAMTGDMLKAIEEVLLRESPQLMIVFGDTNSTLAGALAACKLHIPVAHVESGLRSFNRLMPEEINRILTDHASDLLFCPTESAVEQLRQEGITSGVHCTGDVMLDALLHYQPIATARSNILKELELKPGNFNLVTIHRAENTDDEENLHSILTGLSNTDLPLVFPVHPRTRKILNSNRFQQLTASNKLLRIIEPVGFLDMISLEQSASRILTDSGGIQKEAYWLGKPCITLRNETEWTETVTQGYNRLVGANLGQIVDALQNFFPNHQADSLYGDGKASEGIVRAILEFLS